MSSGRTKIPPQGFDHKPPKNKRFRKVEQPERVYEVPKKPNQFVLKIKAYKLILAFLLQLTKKDKNMLTWIKERLEEPSSYQGIIGLLAAVGYTLNPEALELIASTAVGLISLIQLGKKEKFVDKSDK